MIARACGATLVGVEPVWVNVEVDLQRGLPKFEMIGLPTADVREGKNRILSSLKALGIPWKSRRIVVNLAPASVQKEGAALDLPIALALLKALDVIPASDGRGWIGFGELSLDGKIRRVRGALAVAHMARSVPGAILLVSKESLEELRGFEGVEILGADSLEEIVAHFRGETDLARPESGMPAPARRPETVDWSEVGGQFAAKRALEVAAAGGHNVLLAGPPGVGKSLLALRFATILPELPNDASLEVRRIHGVAQIFDADVEAGRPPVRAPQHHASMAGMVGGGKPFRPGEFTLAHHGVLFMDELPEFRRDILEALREPLQEGVFSLSRAGQMFRFPAGFLFVGAMNLCPCGALGDPKKICLCPPTVIERYRRRVSGPIRDRIDLWVTLVRPTVQEVLGPAEGEKSVDVRRRVAGARDLQSARNPEGRTNGRLKPKEIRALAAPDGAGRLLLEAAVERLSLSARGIHKVLSIARTLADLEEAPGVAACHVAEALSWREPARPT